MKAADVTAVFPLFLRDSAIEWYESLPEAIKTDVSELMDSFKRFFCKSPLDTLFDAESVFTRTQQPMETVREYVAQMCKLAKRIPDSVVIRGLLPPIKAYVIQHGDTVITLDQVAEYGKIAEVAGHTSPTIAYGQLNDIARELKTTGAEVRELTTRMNTLTMSTINSTSSQSPTRRVSFDQSGRPRSPTPTRRYRDDFERPTTPPRYYNNNRRCQNNMSQNRGRLYYRGIGRVFFEDNDEGCSRCGLRHGVSSCSFLFCIAGFLSQLRSAWSFPCALWQRTWTWSCDESLGQAAISIVINKWKCQSKLCAIKKILNIPVQALVDTGAYASCVSRTFVLQR